MSASLGLRTAPGFLIAVAGSIALAALLAAGCTRGDNTNSPAEVRLPPKTAQDVLERVVEAYHQADRYQDAGRLLVEYVNNGQTVSQTREFSLALAGPNRMRMRAYDALVVCDGQNFRATIDEAPGEVLSVAAPDELSPASVYKDAVLSNALNQIAGSLPLSLFLDPEPLPALVINARAPQLDPPAKIGAENCYRVRIEKREGAFVLWIDERTFVVRRVEYPADGYRRLLEPYVGEITGMKITAELEGAALDPEIDNATFRFDVPQGAVLVKQFEVVRFGGRIPKFKLRSLDGRAITRDSLAGKIAVIKFWQQEDVLKYFNDLSGFEQVRKRYEGQDSVVFLTVSPDLDDVSDADLQAAFAEAEVSLPIARIERKTAFRSFGVQIVPTTVILGRDGTLQDHVVGVYPNQTEALAEKIDTLLSGGDLALEPPDKAPNYLFYSGFAWQNAEQEQKEPAQPLPETPAPERPKSGIAPQSEPERLRRTRLWSCTELREPGNILVVPDEDSVSDRTLVIEGLPSVAEIDAAGKVAAKHRLELPDREDAAVTFLRTAVDAAGQRYFLGSKPGVQQLHLFNADWNRLLSFPDEAEHPGIADAALADLDGDGALEMVVGYVQAVGVHCVSLAGERLWRNRAAEYVFRLDVAGADRQGQRKLLVAQGLLLPIDSQGREQPPIVLLDAFLRLIFTADLDGDQTAEWCAIALKSVGLGPSVRDMAVGLSPRGEELWRYELPEGTQQHAAFEMVAAGNLLDGEAAQWVIGAADGSIHILGIDGSLIDRFNYGASLSGLAIARLDGKPALLVSTDEGVEAWRFEE